MRARRSSSPGFWQRRSEAAMGVAKGESRGRRSAHELCAITLVRFANGLESIKLWRERRTTMKKVKPQPLSPYLDEREQQIQDDYEWCWHDPEMQKKYGGKV